MPADTKPVTERGRHDRPDVDARDAHPRRYARLVSIWPTSLIARGNDRSARSLVLRGSSIAGVGGTAHPAASGKVDPPSTLSRPRIFQANASAAGTSVKNLTSSARAGS